MSFIAQREFTADDQRVFARLSGDCNPIHTDALAARRLLFGEPMVHGVHALLWVLDAVAFHLPQTSPGKWLSVRTRFRKPLFLDELVSLIETSRDAGVVHYALRRDDAVLMSIRISVVDAPKCAEPCADDATDAAVLTAQPDQPAFEEAGRCAGRLSAHDSTGPSLLAMFPALGQLLGVSRLAQIALLSAVVGMRVPGRHSLFATLALTLQPASALRTLRPASITYAVDRVSEQFRMVRIGARAAGLRALAEAFFRPPPVEPPPIEALQAQLGGQTFAGRRVLVVGGSRGLGALAASILSAGGADVIVTFASGAAEADALAQHPQIQAAHLDVSAVTDEALEHCFPATVDVLIYCATPRIFFRRTRRLHPERLRSFMECYVSGFARLFERFITQAPAGAACLHPSSVEVERDDAQTVEYRMAKLAGEKLCMALAALYPACRLSAPRLPRLDTDQTAMIGARPQEGTVPYMISLLTDLLADVTQQVPGTERA